MLGSSRLLVPPPLLSCVCLITRPHEHGFERWTLFISPTAALYLSLFLCFVSARRQNPPQETGCLRSVYAMTLAVTLFIPFGKACSCCSPRPPPTLLCMHASQPDAASARVGTHAAELGEVAEQHLRRVCAQTASYTPRPCSRMILFTGIPRGGGGEALLLLSTSMHSSRARIHPFRHVCGSTPFTQNIDTVHFGVASR